MADTNSDLEVVVAVIGGGILLLSALLGLVSGLSWSYILLLVVLSIGCFGLLYVPEGEERKRSPAAWGIISLLGGSTVLVGIDHQVAVGVGVGSVLTAVGLKRIWDEQNSDVK